MSTPNTPGSGVASTPNRSQNGSGSQANRVIQATPVRGGGGGGRGGRGRGRGGTVRGGDDEPRSGSSQNQSSQNNNNNNNNNAGSTGNRVLSTDELMSEIAIRGGRADLGRRQVVARRRVVTPSSNDNNNLNGEPTATPGSDSGASPMPLTPSSDNNINNNNSSSSSSSSSANSANANSAPSYSEEIYGTTVKLSEANRIFTCFFRSFIDVSVSGDALYPKLLEETLMTETYNINLNAANLANWIGEDDQGVVNGRVLYNWLCTYPQEIIPSMDYVVDVERRSRFPSMTCNRPVQVRPFNLLPGATPKTMRTLNPEDIDTLVSIKGMIIRCGPIIPEMRTAYFECANCQSPHEASIENGEIQEPQQCSHCLRKYQYQIIHNRCKFIDKQLVRVQETPDAIPEGDTPHTISVFAFEDLVDVARPGDRVEITAVYKAVPMRVNPARRNVRTVYRTYLDALHFKKSEKGRLQNDDSRAEKGSERYTSFEEGDTPATAIQQEEEKIRELADDPDIYEKLTRSLAPSIYELDNVKKGVLCMLFGGSNVDVSKDSVSLSSSLSGVSGSASSSGASVGKFRGELNVLLCGDPGTSKSQLLQYIHKIAPRGIYTSGKGSSAVGLTASVVKDPESREMTLESGALVLSDRGVCCIDEFDKMSDTTRAILHEVMEQQTVSIAKAGIVCTLNARTSILASANPKESRYNPRLSVVQNIQLPPTLLSRFDLIYLVLDKPSEATDRRLAKHLIGLYYEHVDTVRYDVIPQSLLTRYISYARNQVKPVLSSDAEDLLIAHYTSMRAVGRNNSTAKIVTATPRQLESLIRLSEALARMHLRSTVTVDDVEEAVRLMKVATQTAATDPVTGRIDMDLLTTGQSARERGVERGQTEKLRAAISNVTGSMRVTDLRLRYNNDQQEEEMRFETNEEMKKVLQHLVEESLIKFTTKDREVFARL